MKMWGEALLIFLDLHKHLLNNRGANYESVKEKKYQQQEALRI
jgi:hypothetical protein